jgi:hypothetical protein
MAVVEELINMLCCNSASSNCGLVGNNRSISHWETLLTNWSFSFPVFIKNCYPSRLRTGALLILKCFSTILHTYQTRFIRKGAAEVSQIFLRDTHVLPKLVSYEEHCRRDSSTILHTYIQPRAHKTINK